ncbi:hypothetical protein [uncultured Ruminococcus sp.]|uniref:hypothetical protein n=1 Tax=uncultured Ruminococcus sp. TaxID=165186 RepID=UPI002930DC81|nr:hypothetical protein [uncultured Ruminococcus sp.]
MEQNKSHPLSQTQEDISHLNPYQKSSQQAHHPVDPPVPPTLSPVNGVTQPYPTTPASMPPNIDFDPAVQSAKKKGRISFIFGLISLICMLAALIISETKIYTYLDMLEGLAYLGLIIAVALSIPGIIFGVKSLNRLKVGNSFARVGLILSIITVIVIAIMQVIASISVMTGFAWFLN